MCGAALPPVSFLTKFLIDDELRTCITYFEDASSLTRISIMRCPRQRSMFGGIRQAIPKMPPSRLYRMSSGAGTSLRVLSLKVSSDTNRALERSKKPGRNSVVLTQIFPPSDQAGVECGQSTIL